MANPKLGLTREIKEKGIRDKWVEKGKRNGLEEGSFRTK
jgi:hypothetical protein